MKYETGQEVQLGDKVSVSIPKGTAPARVVMLGADYTHLGLDLGFLDWVNKEHVLNENDVIVEWTEKNPFEHTNPNYAPVGNYMFTALDDGVVFLGRGSV